MQPETIDQQAAGTGAGLGPAFMDLQSVTETSERRGCVPVLEPSSLFGQVGTPR